MAWHTRSPHDPFGRARCQAGVDTEPVRVRPSRCRTTGHGMAVAPGSPRSPDVAGLAARPGSVHRAPGDWRHETDCGWTGLTRSCELRRRGARPCRSARSRGPLSVAPRADRRHSRRAACGRSRRQEMTLTTAPNLFFVLGLPAMLLGGVVLVGFVVYRVLTHGPRS
jgi:hypothetical protein